MDPESVDFRPRDDYWRFQSEVMRVQADLAERVARLERKQEDDSRLKNVWGTSSPFPSVLGVPLQQPTAEHFSSFDDHSSNIINNLQLDADEEPRRLGATSRANSVRFDETANHGHWAHASRSSLDLIPRTGSGMGGHVLSERSYSHKSDGRQSSAGQSVHSMASGRANSLTGFGPTAPLDVPGLAPGLFILGSVPAIIRCWLNTDFKHDTLLYAAVCSGSYTSYVSYGLIKQLGFEDQVTTSPKNIRKIKLSMYLPEAVPFSASSRSSSPAPQLPSVGVEFTVMEEHSADSTAIQIFLGSDMLRAHNADLLFSSNQLTLYDDDRSKLQIPLVRPEDDRAFKFLFVSSASPAATDALQSTKPALASSRTNIVKESLTGLDADESILSATKVTGTANGTGSDDSTSSGHRSFEQRPFLGLSTSIQSDPKEASESSPVSGAPRSGASPAIWSNWRRDQSEKNAPGSLDWANVGKTAIPNLSYQRRDTGIKVLKPSKPARTLSTSTPSPVTGQSRFFDDGKRRGEGDATTGPAPTQVRRTVSGEQPKENVAALTKTRSTNPVGGASAFAWLNSGGTNFTTATTKKRKTAQEAHRDEATTPAPNVGVGVASARSSPHLSASPPRYLPPHLHDEVLADAAPDSGSLSAPDTYAGASSPSEAYASLTLDPSEDTPSQRRPPRSSSPAKRLHSDMDDGSMDVDAPAASAPRRTTQRSARGTSVEMADAPPTSNSGSASSEADADHAASSASSVDTAQQAALPSLDEQVARVMTMMGGEPKERQDGYIISEKWLERVWARTSENISRPQDFSKEATQGPIGPVDNTELVDVALLQGDLVDQRGEDFIPLSKAVQIGQDFEILPVKAWELVVSWYGLKDGSPVIRRYAHNTVPDKSSENIIYELFPPIITIRKVRKTPPTVAEHARPAEKIVVSRYESFLSFVEAAKKAAGIDLNNKVRVWRLLKTAPTDEPPPSQPAGILTPDASPRHGSPATAVLGQPAPLIMDVASFNSLTFGTERELVTGKDEKVNEEFNESLTLADASLTQDQIIVLEEHDGSGEYISDTARMASKNKAGAHSNKGMQSNPNSGRSTPTSGALTRGRTRNGKVRGHVGLTNLGNTCYMNSALQCLRSVEELSMYFLNNKWKGEVNADNPIGHKGAIARVYAGLLNSIYDVGNVSSFSPKNFKQTLGKANSLFSGYGQQDSQEFVSWLVDALHEDLNRVHVKPYRENPDSDDNTFRNPEATRQLGEIYRENHRARNNSVAMDLFNGFYKNTMVCPQCDKVSITFDPYSQLTLQLPIEQTWTHTVTYVPLFGKPFQLEVDIDKNASIKTLKEYVGKRGGGVAANRLMASEVYSHKFYRHLDDKASIAESNIGVRDDIYFYELDNVPSNWPAPKKKGSKYKSLLSHGSSDEDIPDTASSLHDRVLIPVFHRGPSVSSYRAQNFAMALWPFHIVLTREEAKNYDTILRRVLAKVAQSTTRPILSELSAPSLAQSRSSSDVVLTTEEDASSNDPRVKDGSIEGEDMVEVTMTDATTESVAEQFANPVAERGDNDKRIPDVLRPDSYIHPNFRQLFELKHTRRSNEVVTTGWSTVDHSKTLEPISKRIRIPASREESIASSADGSDISSSDEDGVEHFVDAEGAIEAANVSSDEEMQSIESESLGTSRSSRHNKKKSKKARRHERKQERKQKYASNPKTKKGKVADQPNYVDNPDDETDESLIRMGEALILEWSPDAYDALFGGSSDDDPRGMDAMKFVETIEDAEVQEKKMKRAARRKHGITLEECFTETSKSEVLSEDNAWYCSRCKELRRATKTLEIWTVPDILIVHLKRFSGHRSFRDKIEELVDFPVEGLDLSGKVGFPESKDLIYDLFAVDNHYGGLGGGHYTATAQNFFDKQWYDYNDSIVSRCTSGEKAVTRAAYLLFYRRRSSGPLGPPELQEVVTAESNPDSEDDHDVDDQRSRSPAGNGLRLGDSSRNGSSSAGAVAAGAGALRGGGSHLSAAGSHLKNVAALGSLSDDEMDTLPPPYNDPDEGYHDADDSGTYLTEMYAPLSRYDQPAWSFDTLVHSQGRNQDSDDAASDAPNLGSTTAEDLGSRLIEDFGDDIGTRPGVSTPTEGIYPILGGEDGDAEVTEIRLRGD